MAKIEFTGFIEDWTKNNPQHPEWAMKTAEPHRKKDGDKWVTVGRTFRTVKAAYEVQIDFTRFKKGDRVVVTGSEVTEVREAGDRKFYDLVVKAQSVVLAEASGAPTVQAAPPQDTWYTAPVDSEATPF